MITKQLEIMNQSPKSMAQPYKTILKPTDKLTFTLGGRYSFSDDYYARSVGTFTSVADVLQTPLVPDDDNQTFKNFTVQTGATYALADDINLYATYGESFEPNYGLVYVSPGVKELVNPEEGQNYEIGIKGDIGDGFSFSSSVYYMTRSNITEKDRTKLPDGQLRCDDCVVPIGTQRSQGFEIDIFGNITDNFSIMGSLSLMDAEFIDGEYDGLQPSNAPKFGLSIFADYEFIGGVLNGFGVRGGIVHKSGLSTFDRNMKVNGVPFTYEWSDYTEVDAGVYYQIDNWEIDVAVSNLTDTKYYSAAFSGLRWGVNPNYARQYRATLSYSF